MALYIALNEIGRDYFYIETYPCKNRQHEKDIGYDTHKTERQEYIRQYYEKNKEKQCWRKLYVIAEVK